MATLTKIVRVKSLCTENLRISFSTRRRPRRRLGRPRDPPLSPYISQTLSTSALLPLLAYQKLLIAGAPKPRIPPSHLRAVAT
jgi:hypothetical protein